MAKVIYDHESYKKVILPSIANLANPCSAALPLSLREHVRANGVHVFMATHFPSALLEKPSKFGAKLKQSSEF